ncbi:MAG: SDR family NAD(P)-dependent oxidoreductase [Spongiibacteraceae bacterium]
MNTLKNKVAIVTGAGRGIGREHARLFAQLGAAVVVVDRSGADTVAAEIIADGGSAMAFAGNISNWDAARGLVAATVARFGDLHILVNNAGTNEMALFADSDAGVWERALQGNLSTTVCPMHAAVGYWKNCAAQGRHIDAAIINTTSGAGLFGNPGQTHYGAAKAAVAALTLIAAQELSETGIRVNAIAPAARTPMSEESPVVAAFMKAPDASDAFDPWHPRHVSPLVAYLASPQCRLTGKIFHARGGTIGCYRGWEIVANMHSDSPWQLDELADKIPQLVADVERQSTPRDNTYALLSANLRNEMLR